HAAVLHTLENTTLSACADIKMEKAQALAGKYHCAAYASLEEMLDAEEPDVVHLCTPHHLHAPIAAELAKRGIAVFKDKPPVIDREQWKTLQKAAEQVPLGICFQNRYNANVQAVRQIIQERAYGDLIGARAFVTWSRDAGYYQNSGWRGAWATEGGGALINQAIHTLDLLVWLMGRPEQVEATLRNHHLRGIIEVEDTAEVYMVLNGKPALLYATTAYTQNAPVFVEFELERATLRISENTLDILTAEGNEHRRFDSPEPLGKGYWGNGHLPCIADFYASLTAGKPYPNDLASVENTVEALLQIYEKGRN
ncbi:MAG: Gfo/Idh/MocA family oxidoreductase, partial [Clostridia bacterium]|nr:Gfo/Idh/MocA family oxidoreductase [Clostridia bacterium]